MPVEEAVKPRVTSTATAEDADTKNAHSGLEWTRAEGVAGAEVARAAVAEAAALSYR